MFKIEDVYVDDKKLGDLLKAMAGLVKGSPRPVPVANVDAHGKTIKANSSGANLVQVYAEHLHKAKIKQLRPADVRDWLGEHGYSRLSFGYILKGLVKAGVVKRGSGKTFNSNYLVQRAKR